MESYCNYICRFRHSNDTAKSITRKINPEHYCLVEDIFQMTFTDDDLKLLRFNVSNNGPKAFADGIYCEQLVALLARLEKSEFLAETLRECLIKKCDPWPCREAIDAYVAWCKSAGKPS